MNKTNGKHATARSISFHFTFHPVLIVGPFIEYYDNFTFLELQFIIIVRITVVQCPATSPFASLNWYSKWVNEELQIRDVFFVSELYTHEMTVLTGLIYVIYIVFDWYTIWWYIVNGIRWSIEHAGRIEAIIWIIQLATITVETFLLEFSQK